MRQDALHVETMSREGTMLCKWTMLHVEDAMQRDDTAQGGDAARVDNAAPGDIGDDACARVMFREEDATTTAGLTMRILPLNLRWLLRKHARS